MIFLIKFLAFLDIFGTDTDSKNQAFEKIVRRIFLITKHFDIFVIRSGKNRQNQVSICLDGWIDKWENRLMDGRMDA